MKQHGILVAGFALATSLALVASVEAQPMGAPPSAPAPEMTAPMPAPPPMPVAPAPAPMVAAPAPPVGPDNMAGQLGLGVGVTAGDSLIKPGVTLMLKYWLSDSVALVPQIQVKIYTRSNIDNTNWAIAPGTMLLFSPWKTTSTRLNIGGGVGLIFSKWGPPTVAGEPPDLATLPNANPTPDVYVAVTVPLHLGVEHFFTKWFSMGLAVQDNLLTYAKQGGGHALEFSLDSTTNITGIGSLFFYTD